MNAGASLNEGIAPPLHRRAMLHCRQAKMVGAACCLNATKTAVTLALAVVTKVLVRRADG